MQQALKIFEHARKHDFQKRAAFPRFKKRGQHDALRYPQGAKLEQENGHLFLPKFCWVRFRNSREVIGEMKNVIINTSCSRWYVRTQMECEVSVLGDELTRMVGLDVGIVKLATLSDGTLFESVNSLKKVLDKFVRLQREMSCEGRFRNHWKKSKCKVEKLQAQIKHIRRDYLHKVSTTFSKNHVMIVIEGLRL